MNNILTVSNSQLPVHLQHLAGKLATSSLSSGISAGGHPRISIKGGRFRLQQTNGEEFLVPQSHLDVIIVDANDKLSKIYYATKWDPSTPDGLMPDCWSDNGVGPSDRASKPQHGNCASCPQNVWGSKISEASGKQVKVCQDVKKVAVLIAANPSGPVFELRIPGDSLKNLASYATGLEKHGIPFSTVITRISFDTTVSHQRLIFNPAYDVNGQMPYITAEMAEIVSEVLGTDEVDQCTGKNDKPVQAGVAYNQNGVHPSATANAPKPLAAQQNAPTTALTAVGAPPSLPASSPGESPRRTRRTKAETAAGTQAAMAATAQINQGATVPSTEADLPRFVRNMPPVAPSNASQVAPLTAPVTNAALDETIRNLMSL